MSPKSKPARDKSSAKKEAEVRVDRSELLKEIGESTSTIIQKAALILEEEVAAGIIAASEIEKSMREGGDIRSDEFDNIMQRLRKDAHDVVDIIGRQVEEVRSSEFDELAGRFQKDAHGAVDVILNVVNAAPDIINRLLNRDRSSQDNTREKGKQ